MQWDDSCDSTRQDKGHKRCVQAKWTKTDSASLAVIIKTSDLSPAQNLRTAYTSQTLLAVQLGRVPFHDCAYNMGAHMHLFSLSKTVVGLAAIGIASLTTAEPLHGPGSRIRLACSTQCRSGLQPRPPTWARATRLCARGLDRQCTLLFGCRYLLCMECRSTALYRCNTTCSYNSQYTKL